MKMPSESKLSGCGGQVMVELLSGWSVTEFPIKTGHLDGLVPNNCGYMEFYHIADPSTGKFFRSQYRLSK